MTRVANGLLVALAAAACAPDTPALQSFATADGTRSAAAASEPAAVDQGDATVLWQLSAFALLVRGYYDGILPVAEVQRHGNLGLGAADQLNGEMALVDGRFYQFLEGGRAVRPPPSMRMPFAAVTLWTGGRNVPLRSGLEYGTTFRAAVDAAVPNTNAFYALRMEGTFDVVVARTYKRQTRPYPPLGRAAADTFTFRGVRGTMVGFREPSYADSLSVPLYHLHFVNADGTRGGHVISFTTRAVRLQVSERPTFTLHMPPASAAPR